MWSPILHWRRASPGFSATASMVCMLPAYPAHTASQCTRHHHGTSDVMNRQTRGRSCLSLLVCSHQRWVRSRLGGWCGSTMMVTQLGSTVITCPLYSSSTAVRCPPQFPSVAFHMYIEGLNQVHGFGSSTSAVASLPSQLRAHDDDACCSGTHRAACSERR